MAATTAGFAATVTLAVPAHAAGEPTISITGTNLKNGVLWGAQDVTISGTAPPNSTVRLIEAAYVYRTDMRFADNFNGGTVSTTADSNGRYSMPRYVDSGFVFQVQASAGESGPRSPIIEVPVIVNPVIHSITSPAANTVAVQLEASPGQPYLGVEIERRSGNGWVVVASGNVGNGGQYTRTITGEPGGAQSYRVWMDGDPANLLTGSYSASTIDVAVQGSGAGTNPGTPAPQRPSAPPPSNSTPAPAPPATPKPAPAPAVPGVGSVKFTKFQVDAPGSDTSRNANDEWFRLTNTTASPIDLKNWSVREAGGRVYRFSGTVVLAPGEHTWIRTGKGTNGVGVGHRYWGSSSHLWNNSGDTATLRNGVNKTIDTCRWTRSTKITYC